MFQTTTPTNSPSEEATKTNPPVAAKAKRESRIKYAAKGKVPIVPVGDEDYGILNLKKIHGLTILEKEYVEKLLEDKGIKDEFEQTVEFAEMIVAKHNDEEQVYSQKQVNSLLLSIMSLQPDEELSSIDPDIAYDPETISGIIGQARTILGSKKELEVHDIVSRLMDNDQVLVSKYMKEMMEWNKERDQDLVIKNQVLATAMLKFRHIDDPDSWSFEDTLEEIAGENLHHKTIEALATFASNEQNHWNNNEELAKRKEADLKKRLAQLKKDEQKSKVGRAKK